MTTTSQTTTILTEKPIRNRSIGSRASEKEADTIGRWAKSERMNVSDWIMKSIRSYTTIKNNKEILLDCLRNERQNFISLLDLNRKKQIDELIRVIENI